jgi:hypothetical protein
MSTRYRWFRIEIPPGKGDLVTRIARFKFSQGATWGFATSDNRSSSFRFLWRTKVIVNRLDENGIPNSEEVESINFSDFCISEVGGLSFLRIENPPRTTRDLLNALETVFGMGFTTQPVQFDRAQPSTFFNSVTSSKLVGLKVAGAVVGEDLVARMEFASKEGMHPENMSLLDGLKYKVDLAVFEVLFQGLRGQVSFSSSGMVKIGGQLANLLVSLIEADLPSLVRKY